MTYSYGWDTSHNHTIIQTTSTNYWPYRYQEKTVDYGRVDFILADFLKDLAQDASGDKKKEKPAVKSRQAQIDEEVVKALDEPRRQAEVARRIELAQKIGLDTYDDGTALRWSRKYDKIDYQYAALKVKGKWYVTGSTMVRTQGWSWDELVQWMITGENTAESIQVATTWSDLA